MNDKSDSKSCSHCYGTGIVFLEGSIHGEDICPKCRGTGRKPYPVLAINDLVYEEVKNMLTHKKINHKSQRVQE